MRGAYRFRAIPLCAETIRVFFARRNPLEELRQGFPRQKTPGAHFSFPPLPSPLLNCERCGRVPEMKT